MDGYKEDFHKKLLTAVWESSADAMRITDSDGKVLNVNSAYCGLTGFVKDDLIGKPFEIVYEKRIQDGLQKYYKGFITSGNISERADKTLTFINGKQCHLEASYSFINISGEKYVLSIFRDITEFMKAIDSKNESNDKYRLLTEIAKDIILIYNLKGEISYLNPSALKYTGLTEDNYQGVNFIKFIPEEYYPILESNLKERKDGVTGSRLYELEMFNYEGKRIPIEVNSSPIIVNGKIKSMLTIARDISERKEAEKALKENEDTFHRLFDESADPILLLNETGFVDCNQATISLLGYKSKEEFLNKQPWELSPYKQPDGMLSSAKAEAMISKALKDGYNRFEWIHTKSDGTDFPVEVMLTPIVLKGKQFYYTIWRDITERKRAEHDLQIKEERYRTLFNLSPAGIVVLDKTGNIIECNDAVSGFLQYTYEELCSMNVSDIAHPDFQNKIDSDIKDILNGKDLKQEVKNIRKDGSVCTLELYETKITLPNGQEGILSTVNDITDRKQAEEKLESLNEQLLNLIEAIPDAIFFKDGDGKWLITNELAKSLFKLHGYDWYGKTDMEMAKERPELKNTYEECFSNDEKAWDEKKLSMFEEIIIDDNGDEHQFEVTKVPLYEKDGSRKALVIVGMEITHRKKTEEEIRKLSSAVEQSPASILITDLNGNIVYANSKTSEITGYSLQELMGKNPHIFQSDENPKELYDDLWKTITSGKEWRGEFHNRKKNGESYWESAAISPILNNKGQTTHYLAIKEDVTDRKNIISELKIAKEKAEAGDRLKTAFMQNISHEIRTPLNGILGFGQIMAEPDLSEQQRTEYLEMLNESSQRLIKTITDYMDISLIVTDSININLKSFEIKGFLKELSRRYIPQCKEKNLILSLDVPEEVGEQLILTDKEILQKVFSQLLDNSLKFTKEGTISFGYSLADNSVRFFVKDTGIGISTVAKENIFKHFTQEDTSTARGYEGSGLGLTITKGFIELLGGNIWLESEKGAGTVLYFTLPISIENVVQSEIPGINDRSKPKEKPYILFAEDEVTNSRFLEAILKKRSTLFIAKNGNEAVQLIKEHPEINIVLMDLKMPEMDGFEATRQIKSIRKDIPIIAITAYAQSGDEQKALEAGCDDYITKPLNKEFLFEMIEKYVNFKP